jgi:hypothetical protein
VTDEILQGLAAQGLNLMRRDIARGGFNFLLASYTEGGQLHRMKKVEDLIIEKLGKPWLNYGRTKDLGFGILAYVAAIAPPDAIVICTPINWFKATAKLRALPPDEVERMMRSTHDEHHKAAKKGYLQIVDALCASAQNERRVCNYIEAVRAGTPPECHFFDQQAFEGRLKMYGRSPQQIIRDADLAELDLPV